MTICFVFSELNTNHIINHRILLVDWVKRCWSDDSKVEAADGKLRRCYVVEEVELVLKLGLFCAQMVPQA